MPYQLPDEKRAAINPVRTYGTAPYRIATIHGGPGAIGSLGDMSEQLSAFCNAGVIEPLQSRYTVQELIDELHEQLQCNALFPITLIGHSWGAWLAILYADRYPEETKKLILVGAPPFEDKYVRQIMERRLQNLSETEAIHLQKLLQEPLLPLEEIEKLIDKSDNYAPLPPADAQHTTLHDTRMNRSIWQEAATMRSKGQLKQTVSHLTCPLYIIHGENDPHPAEGVIEPLNDCRIPYTLYLLPRCGHSPFNEKEWRNTFYHIIASLTTPTRLY